jgi:cation:H+ antiporter
VIEWIEAAGAWAPWLFLLIFLAASFLMIWRLEALNAAGLEGTVLGTLVMPYCSGIGNLIFAFVMAKKKDAGGEVLTNCLVNNVTNLTLLIGLPTILWGEAGAQKKTKGSKKQKQKEKQERRINKLSMLLTLAAVLFFTGATWILASDGLINSSKGLVLIGTFLFWQCFHVFDVLKSNARKNQSFGWMLPVDLLLLGVGAYATYVSTDWLVDWTSKFHSGFISAKYLGWLSGWLMVVPNGLLAFYYARRGNPEVVYTSQVGDGHICIPLCIGVFTLFQPIQASASFQTGLGILLAAAVLHFCSIALWGRLPRVLGWVLTAAYGVFLYTGLLK